jgi:hypothetical protein
VALSHRRQWDVRLLERAKLVSTWSKGASTPTSAVIAAVAGGRRGSGVGMMMKDSPGNADRIPWEDGDG